MYHDFRFFSDHPDLQKKFFPQMDVNELDTLVKHGTTVVRWLDQMVVYVIEGQDEILIGEIHKVSLALTRY